MNNNLLSNYEALKTKHANTNKEIERMSAVMEHEKIKVEKIIEDLKAQGITFNTVEELNAYAEKVKVEFEKQLKDFADNNAKLDEKLVQFKTIFNELNK